MPVCIHRPRCGRCGWLRRLAASEDSRVVRGVSFPTEFPNPSCTDAVSGPRQLTDTPAAAEPVFVRLTEQVAGRPHLFAESAISHHRMCPVVPTRATVDAKIDIDSRSCRLRRDLPTPDLRGHALDGRICADRLRDFGNRVDAFQRSDQLRPALDCVHPATTPPMDAATIAVFDAALHLVEQFIR
jgi:hypothetical protein